MHVLKTTPPRSPSRWQRFRAWLASLMRFEGDPHPLADYRDPSELDVAETEQRHGREGE